MMRHFEITVLIILELVLNLDDRKLLTALITIVFYP